MRNFLPFFILLFFAACATDGAQAPTDLSNRKSTMRRIAESIKQSGNVQAAAQIESEIIKLDEHDVGSFVTLAKTVRAHSSNRDSIEVLKTGAELNPASDTLKIELARAYIEDNSPLQAAAQLDSLSDKNSRDYFNLRGVAEDIQGNYSSAQAQYNDGLKHFQRDSLLLNNYALSYIFEKKYDAAIRILVELAKRNNNPKFKHNLALAYGLKGDTKKAKQILGRELKPEEVNENLQIYKQLR